MPIVYQDRVRGEARFGPDIPSMRSDVLTEQFAQTFEENPIKAFSRWSELREDERTGPRLDATTARQKLKDAGLETHLKVNDAGITSAALATLMDRKRNELKRQEIFARSQGGFVEGAERLGLSIATTLADPISAGLNFVPVVGQVRYGRWLAEAGSIAGRIGVRAGVGALEGTVGAALQEPFIYGMRTQEQADYDSMDSLLNITLGGIAGAGLHSTVGTAGELIARRLRPEVRARVEPTIAEEGAPVRAAEPLPADIQRTLFRPEAPEVARAMVENLAPETQHAALRAAVGQAVEGRPIDVEAIVRSDPSTHDPLLERLQSDQGLRATLNAMRGETGWAEVGGKVIMDEDGKVLGRTTWIPREEWWRERPKGLTEDQVHAAVDKALSGERLGKRERSMVEFMRDVADERQRLTEYLPSQEELAAQGLKGVDDAYETALVARAAELDETVVERLAIEHENDSDGFLKAVKEFLDQNEAPAPRGAVGQGAPAEKVAPVDNEFRAAVAAAEEILAREPVSFTDSEIRLKAAEDEAQLAVSDAKSSAKRLGQEFNEDDISENLAKAERWAQIAELATVCLTR